MDQFTCKEQIKHYNESRPAYTKEMFEEIIKNTNGNDFYIDVACGSGQLTIPLSKNFKVSVGLDISDAQVSALKDNISKLDKNDQQNIFSFVTDPYNIQQLLFDNKLISDANETGFVDLITIGEAFHWFEENKLLFFLKSLLKKNGVLVIAGYKCNIFNPQAQCELYNILENIWDKLAPYGLYDRSVLDNAYENSYDNFKKYFSDENSQIRKPLLFNDESEVFIEMLFPRIKSTSLYINYIKTLDGKEDHILEDLKKSLKNFYKIDNSKPLEGIVEKINICYFIIFLKN